MIGRIWKPFLRRLLQRAAQGYVVGAELIDALRRARSVDESTLCFWDGPGDLPRHVADVHLAASRAIAEERLDSYVSIKAPSLDFDLQLLKELAQAGGGVRVHFDSLGPETVTRTFDLIAGLDCPVGVTIPGRWRRSPQDARRAADMGARVRVVKGQWADPGGEIDPQRGVAEVIDAVAGLTTPVAVATHNPVLAAEAIGKLQSAGTPCEMELLYGFPDKAARRVSRDLGVQVRYYLPYGHAWLPYALRQAARDPRIFWWMLRDAARN
jgi:proline dehydrogenase